MTDPTHSPHMPGAFPSFPDEDPGAGAYSAHPDSRPQLAKSPLMGDHEQYPDPPVPDLPVEGTIVNKEPHAISNTARETADSTQHDAHDQTDKTIPQQPNPPSAAGHQPYGSNMHRSPLESLHHLAHFPPLALPAGPQQIPARIPVGDHHVQQHYMQKTFRRQYQEQPHLQIVTQIPEAKANINEQMQMMMMQQMLMQQMQAQQMHAAQMAALTQQTLSNQVVQNQGSAIKHAAGGRGNKRGGSVNIQSIQRKRKVRSRNARAMPVVAARGQRAIVAPPPVIVGAQTSATLDSMAMENWQEATILLCIAVVGVIYLICSRAGGEEDKKKESIAKKHMS